MELRRAAITAVSHYVPEKILSNHDLEKMVDTNDEWIRTRTGIRERHILEKGATSDLVTKAVKQVLKNRGIAASEIDLIIVATITPDMMLPTTACIVQDRIGARNAWAFDLNAACSGFLYALSVGSRFIETGVHSKVIIVGADKMSSITDYTDRNTCVLFGDAAAAVLLEPTDEKEYGILDQRLYSDGSGGKYLNIEGRWKSASGYA
jgi:3-oxoacyl-[acyl-carrier-protein] synthase III